MFSKLLAFGIPTLGTFGNLPLLKPTGRFIPLPNHVTNSNTSILFIPGTGVKPKEYFPVLDVIKSECGNNSINVDINIVKFTGNMMHRFEVDSVVSDVNNFYKNNNYDNIIFIGHSAGGSIGMQVAKKMDRTPQGIVSWCSSFNSMGDLPWDTFDPMSLKNTSSLTILAENDKQLPLTIALREFCDKSHIEKGIFVSVLRQGDHFSGLSSYKDSSLFSNYEKMISGKISMFIESCLVSGNSTANDYMKWETNRTIDRYSGVAVPQDRMSVTKLFQGGEITGVKSKTHQHYSVPPDMLLTFLYISVPFMKPLIHYYVLMLSFIFSQPDENNSYSFSPLPDILPIARFNSPPLWVKVKGLPEHKNRAKDMNKAIFKQALDSVTSDQKSRYLSFGKKMVFGNDISIPLVPFCNFLWLFTPLITYDSMKSLLRIFMMFFFPLVKYESDGSSVLMVQSPTIDIGSRINAKILSKQECIEWIITKSFL